MSAGRAAMQLTPTQLSAALQRGLQPVYVISGDAPLLVDEAAAQIRRHLSHAERRVADASGTFRWQEFFAEFDGLSLFASQRLLEVRLPGGKPGIEGGKALEAWAANPAPDCTLLLLLPRLDRATQNSKWFTALERAGTVVSANAPGLAQLPQWIGERLARYGLKAERSVLDWLAVRVEGNLLAAHQEIEKLSLLLPPGPVTLDDVRAAVTDVARYDASDIPDTVWRGDTARFLRITASLKSEGESPILALWLLVQDLRTLHRLALGARRGENSASLMRSLRVWESRQALFSRALKRLTHTDLAHALQHASRVDRASKGLLREDGWNLFTQLGLSLQKQPAPAFQ